MGTTVSDDRSKRTPRRGGGHLFPQRRAESKEGPPSPVEDGATLLSTMDGRVQRVLNVAIATLGLLLTAPLFILIALAIKLTSPGPVFYRQARIGMDRRTRRESLPEGKQFAARRVRDLGGEPFRIYKFRTMYLDAERDSGAVWATSADPRVTQVGRLLRQFRLDELPQLFNVICGDMNIVGPRPERPAIFANMRAQVDNYSVRQRTRPGITGLAQINQAYDSSVEDVRKKVEFDLEYIARRSVTEDLKIMIKTIPVILFRRGGW